jgi:hypothetical protein
MAVFRDEDEGDYNDEDQGDDSEIVNPHLAASGALGGVGAAFHRETVRSGASPAASNSLRTAKASVSVSFHQRIHLLNIIQRIYTI